MLNPVPELVPAGMWLGFVMWLLGTPIYFLAHWWRDFITYQLSLVLLAGSSAFILGECILMLIRR